MSDNPILNAICPYCNLPMLGGNALLHGTERATMSCGKGHLFLIELTPLHWSDLGDKEFKRLITATNGGVNNQ